MKRVLCFCAVFAAAAAANAALIDFDNVTAPSTFASANPLRAEYAALGVTFEGPSTLDGGAILNQLGGFGISARSAPNFLAFNRGSTMANGGTPRDPETIRFNVPALSASIYASGGTQATSFQMDAYLGGNLVATDAISVPAQTWGLLNLSSPMGGFDRLVLTETGGDNAFLYDDFEFTLIPEPASLLLVLASVALLRRR